jgi:hypothetical protein
MSTGTYTMCDICSEGLAKAKCSKCGKDICLNHTRAVVLYTHIESDLFGIKSDVSIRDTDIQNNCNVFLCVNCSQLIRKTIEIMKQTLGTDDTKITGETAKVRKEVIKRLIQVLGDEVRVLAL